MSDHYDYVPSYDSEGNLRHYATAEPEFESVSSGEINNKFTPDGGTIKDIQDIVDKTRRDVFISLEPGVLYEGNTQLVLNSVTNSGEGRIIKVDAWGSGINYTGSKDTAVKIRQGSIGDSNFKGRVEWDNGTVFGPSQTQTNSAAIRGDDVYGAHIYPTKVANAQHGIMLVNNQQWCENCDIGFHRQGGYEGNNAPTFTKPKYLVRTVGGGSSFPNSNGSKSFRNTDVYIPFREANDESGAKTFWQDNATHHGGYIDVRGFIPNGGIGYHIDNPGTINKHTIARYEGEGGNSNSVGLKIDSTVSPIFTDIRVASNGTDVAGSQPARTLSGGGRKTYNGFPNFTLATNATNPGWDWQWLEAGDGNGVIYSFGNHRDDLTLRTHNGGGVRTADASDNPVKMLASEFQLGQAGRKVLGTFANHPNANNGDMWYIDGSGTPSEGFYGMKSSGVVQIG